MTALPLLSPAVGPTLDLAGHFRCVTLSCTLMVRRCLERQDARRGSLGPRGASSSRHPFCAASACEQGRHIRAAVGNPAPGAYAPPPPDRKPPLVLAHVPAPPVSTTREIPMPKGVHGNHARPAAADRSISPRPAALSPRPDAQPSQLDPAALSNEDLARCVAEARRRLAGVDALRAALA